MSKQASDQSHFIGQIQQKEKEAVKLLEVTESENNEKVVNASETANQIVAEVEQEAKNIGQEHLKQAKENAKVEFKHILVDEGNKRRDVIESGKGNLDKANKFINNKFSELFKVAA